MDCCRSSRDVGTSQCTLSSCPKSQPVALSLPRLLQIFINGSLSPDVQFRENEATGRGGGVYVDLASCVLSRHDHLAQGTDFGRQKSHCFLSILERNTTKVSNWYLWSDFYFLCSFSFFLRWSRLLFSFLFLFLLLIVSLCTLKKKKRTTKSKYSTYRL